MNPASHSTILRVRRAGGVVAALAALALAQPQAAANTLGPRLATMDVYDRNDGTALTTYAKDEFRYIVGTPGHEYAVRIRNCTGERILVVTSVDGINVLSGDTASPEQSGYVIEPWGSVEIAGWRKSLDRTAAFYFTDLGDSYAARTGRPGNIGVIGVAVFREKQPPIAYRPPRDPLTLGGSLDARERGDAPTLNAPPQAPAAAPSLADTAPVLRQEQSVDRAAKSLASPLGTGHGRNETSYAQRVAFERASSSPGEVITLRYDRRDNLIAMGVLPSRRLAQRAPDPFPAMRFAPDPR